MTDVSTYGRRISLADVPPPPCDRCKHSDECAECKLACQSFFRYVSLLLYQGQSRVPSKKFYDLSFRSDHAG
jgi:hypothetical protein